jgi:hypothetical protein
VIYVTLTAQEINAAQREQEQPGQQMPYKDMR